ncbi:cytochrome P450 [Novosphingobium sp. M1R2S20]|uniref:Cytochrome P450 n=1 Tax=Novosphingobium rhizovicinum TaxID=3228928 RepID=A0ABV3REN2_9SPHN
MTAQTESATRAGVPDHVPAELVIDFDICADHGMKKDVFQRLDELRASAPPVAYSPYNGGHWMVFDEEHIKTALTSPDRFTTSHLNQYLMAAIGAPFIPLGLEPPEHGPWRNVLIKYLGPARIKKLEEAVRRRAEELIGEVADKGRCDFVSEVAVPMPITIFMELMGLPLERFPEFRALAVRILDPEGLYDPAQAEARADANAQVMGMLGEVIAARREDPRDDLVSALIQESVRGTPIGPQELLSMCYVLFLGGLDTVTNAMCFGMRYLAMDPDLQQDLRDHPEHIKDTAEWLLRRSAFVNVQRSVAVDTELNGVAMKAGDMIWNIVWSGSNTPGSDNRGPHHYAFGAGHHLCLGMHLARMELRIMYETWMKRIGPFRLAQDEPVAMEGGPIMHIKRMVLEY